MPGLGQNFPYVLPDAGSDRRWCLRDIQITLLVRLAARISSRSLTSPRLAVILPFFMRGGALERMVHCWRIQKVGNDTAKTEHFSFSVGNIDHRSCLEKVEHPYENRFRQQYISVVLP